MAAVTQRTVEADEAGMRVDRWFKSHYPGLGFGALQKLLRSGQVRVDGGRVKTQTRLEAGQTVRVPPIGEAASAPRHMTANTIRDRADGDVLAAMLLYEDPKVLVFNKPAGLAVQGGSGVTRSVDSMLEAWRDRKGVKPRLVHRLDRDTSGVMAVARTRGAAQALTKAFRERTTRKLYWALVHGVPSPRDARISNWLHRDRTPDGDRMRVVKHGTPDADHAVSEYRVIDSGPRSVSWLELQPHTGRTHQLRVHCQNMDHAIVGDDKYPDQHHREVPGGVQNKLHLHARRLIVPHPDTHKPPIDVTAALPPHMEQSWNLFGFDEADGAIDDD